MLLVLSIVVWGHPNEKFGCLDKSGISQVMTAYDGINFTCGDTYTRQDGVMYIVDWTWFTCVKAQYIYIKSVNF